ncbi:c-type cytochrome biogenesis protein CcmI [Sagittula stellata]|uniref:Putative cytochrome c-type biogenesis protein, cycH n=1 Tax=Sagittula stellata (strain ATCC 700073 / DSM 11524 / E-37) TaxID=388399 RepID=A3K136_SAGS3|nr:c-type cytochrome biogenesis protein CcmI [Sagittula stellata]EBA09501.1 Putative cytochrome c-type biogenesis protein, cycH [Sagittula stellata E-37]
MVFWILTGAVALVVAAGLGWSVLRGTRETGPAEAFDMQVYRDQLSEIDNDAARGKIDAEEAERLRLEISRRLLSADAKAQVNDASVAQPKGVSRVTAGLLTLVLLVGGFGLYLALGVPGYRDQPLQMRLSAAADALKNRTSQADAEARLPAPMPDDAPDEYLDLVVKLRAAVEARPNELQGQILLARSEAALGNYRASYQAQQKIIELKGDQATAEDYANLADMMVLAANGYVSPEAQKALEQALGRDPENGVARFYGGLMMAQIGRPDRGFRMWRDLLSDSQPDDPWVAPLRAQIEEMAMRAGETRFQLPPLPTARGPSQSDMDAAADMTPEARQEMIRGMVNQLSERLANEGGAPEEWARLISSLAVLGDTERAGAIWTEAKTVFAGNEAALQTIRDAARSAGVSE